MIGGGGRGGNLRFPRMEALYKNSNERDLRFYKEMRNEKGYPYLKRLFVEEATEETKEKWRLADRKHFAKWKLRMRLKKESDARRTEEILRRRRNETAAQHITDEYERLESKYWKEAPIMLPYQRKYWAKGWDSYYWKNTKCQEDIEQLGEELNKYLYIDIQA